MPFPLIAVMIGDAADPKNRQLALHKAALGQEGIDVVAFTESLPDLLAGNFSARDYIDSVAPESLQLCPAFVGSPVVKNDRYHTVKVKFALHGHGNSKQDQPAIWCSAYQDDIGTAAASGVANEAARGWEPGRIVWRMFCPICFTVGDPESKLHYTGSESEWQAAGLDMTAKPDAFMSGAAACFARFTAADSATPVGMPLITPYTFEPGVAWDKLGTYAASWLAACQAAAPGTQLVPMNLTTSGTRPQITWAQAYAESVGAPYGCQLGTSATSEKDIIASCEVGLASGAAMIQVHDYQAEAAAKWAVVRRATQPAAPAPVTAPIAVLAA